MKLSVSEAVSKLHTYQINSRFYVNVGQKVVPLILWMIGDLCIDNMTDAFPGADQMNHSFSLDSNLHLCRLLVN